ncbi:uroporphyrinogen-III synthase [Natronobacterium gregoryi]|uniref:Uroporphyrinogen-III synthase n=2 Tax=Natronobacterium gregoryi TaxID=44930 RepID=L0AFJ5_NATGS|nr:uroporphyrinogen-III synthase [Natronobacterium gregoryi]AFZ72668.1 uroporphyrinogen-III synthase [Natronobacterium gregoryi SP2]ELY69043.1 uroporphyrinogen-III synthase [Natronobacterium gregoryi SP2]PLK20622.1 uroporphyrinogen-III synthase [Natronobacterium gregoryi SP2]SFI91056.1 uroporphyrinogen-III synthase [Natronobacterium gregoryi]
MSATDRPTIAVFRPGDERIEDATDLLESLGAEPVPDPMLAVDPTAAEPRTDADYVVLTSKTGVELVADARWEPGDATVCAIGPATADVLREAGYEVDVVPEEYTSSGLVATLEDEVAGARVEVARSDHGSDVLLEGLEDAGAYVHETVLYRLVRPEESGRSAELAADGDLDGLCFTSSLTVEHFLEAADACGVREDVLAGLEDATVGVIGEPTAETAREQGIEADLVASEATFEALAHETLEETDDEH